MDFNAIKLNPSQELKLLKARAALFGSGQPLSLDKQSGRVRQKFLAGHPIFLQPLLCLVPNDFDKEEFLSIQKFEIHSPKGAAAGLPTCFWARITTKARALSLPIPFALDHTLAKDFSLEKIFALAAGLADSANRANAAETCVFDGLDFLFCPSSFKLCRVQTTKNEWRLYDDVWKKLKI